MTEIETINIPSVKPKVKIDKTTKRKLLNKVKEDSQVVVHCSYTGSMWDDRIRIWKSTFLYAKDSSHRSKLVLTENITLYPTWMRVENGRTVIFTLIFTGLPRDCKYFDLIEKIPAPGGFIMKNIKRNNSDVYSIDLTI